MSVVLSAAIGVFIGVLPAGAARAAAVQQVDYQKLWDTATPFHMFLENVNARKEQWRSRFADAAVEPEALTRARALPGRRHMLIVAEDRCSDSAWAVPYLAKLAAAVPDKLDVRILTPAEGRRIQSAHLTPDGRLATPTVVVLDDAGTVVGAWVERPAELQKWYIEHKDALASDRYAHLAKWYADDAGRTTIREILALFERQPAGGQ